MKNALIAIGMIAAGAILDYLADDKEFVMQNAIDKALLAGNKIKYRKGKEE